MRASLATAAAFLLFLAGCGEEVERAEAVPLEQVPAEAMKTAAKAQPGIKFTMARKVKYQGKDAYEIIGKNKEGKTVEAEVSPTGELFAIE